MSVLETMSTSKESTHVVAITVQSSGLRAYNTGKAALRHVGGRGREAPLRPSRPKQSAITYGFRADGALSHCQ